MLHGLQFEISNCSDFCCLRFSILRLEIGTKNSYPTVTAAYGGYFLELEWTELGIRKKSHLARDMNINNVSRALSAFQSSIVIVDVEVLSFCSIVVHIDRLKLTNTFSCEYLNLFHSVCPVNPPWSIYKIYCKCDI